MIPVHGQTLTCYGKYFSRNELLSSYFSNIVKYYVLEIRIVKHLYQISQKTSKKLGNLGVRKLEKVSHFNIEDWSNFERKVR